MRKSEARSIGSTAGGHRGWRQRLPPAHRGGMGICMPVRDGALFPFGDDVGKLGEHAWFSENAGGKTHPVGQKTPNGWGLFDMLGNVWEWCADGYDEKYYSARPPRTRPARPRPRTGSSGAVAGTTSPGTAARRTAAGTRRGTGSATWASAWPQSRNELGTEPRSGGRTGGEAEPTPGESRSGAAGWYRPKLTVEGAAGRI